MVKELNEKNSSSENEKLITVTDIKGMEQKYPIKFTPATVNFIGEKDMDKAIDTVVNEFQNVGTLLENNPRYLPEAKKARTFINQLAQSLTEGKKETVTQSGKQVIEFETRIQEKVKTLKGLSADLKKGIDVYENEQKQKKQSENLKRIQKMLAQRGISDSYLDEVKEKYNPKWNNKTFSEKMFVAEVNQILDVCEQEQKKHNDDVQLILDSCKKLDISVDENHFVSLLDKMSVREVLQEIDEYEKQLKAAVNHDWQGKNEPAEAENAAEENSEPEKIDTVEKNNTVIDKETGEIIAKKVSVKIGITCTKEQLKELTKMLRQFTTVNHISDDQLSLEYVQ